MSGQTVDVSTVIDEGRLRPFHWLVLGLCAFVTVIDGYDLLAMGLVVPTLSQQWQLDPQAFSPALSAAVVGVLIGSAIAGRLGDLIGRRWTLVIMLVISAVFMALTALADTMDELIVYRFFTGLGAGGSIPVAIAYTAEYMPAARRNTLVAVMYSGAPLGSVLAGGIGPTVIGRYDWHGVFWVGGVLTGLAALVLALFLPESIRYLVVKRAPRERIQRLLARIDPRPALANTAEFVVREASAHQGPWRELLGPGKRAITCTLWAVFVVTQFVIFYIGLWMPTVLVRSGLALESAMYVVAIYNLGGALGGPVCGWLSDRYSAQRVLAVVYPIAGFMILTVIAALASPVLPGVALLAGVVVIGCSICLGALSASLYPTGIRSTGVGFALGIGRLGSIVAPIVGGWAVASGRDDVFFGIAALGSLICTAGVVLLGRFSGSTDKRYRSA